MFTDQQVYYECYGMYCCEVLNLPLQDLHTKDHQRFKKPYCNGKKIGMFPRGVGGSAWEVVQRIEEYSQKSLKSPSDVLNGILGILRVFETSVHSIRHYLGVPILPAHSKAAPTATEPPKKCQWSPAMGFFSGLCWDLTESSIRRPGFPSWSWTGWFGPVRWGFEEDKWKSLQVDPDVTLSVELRDGQIMDWDTFQRSYDKLSKWSGLSNFIHISAWTTPIRILGYEGSGKEVYCIARVDLEDASYLRWRFHPTTCRRIPNQMCTAIHLARGTPENGLDPTGPALMVVCEVEDRIERVGFGWIDQYNYTFYDSNSVGEYDNIPDPPGLWRNSMYARRPMLVKSWQETRLG